MQPTPAPAVTLLADMLRSHPELVDELKRPLRSYWYASGRSVTFKMARQRKYPIARDEVGDWFHRGSKPYKLTPNRRQLLARVAHRKGYESARRNRQDAAVRQAEQTCSKEQWVTDWTRP